MFLQNPLHFRISEAARSGPLQVALATTTIFVSEANTTNYDALQLGGAAVDLGVEYLQRTYNETFNFTHTYLLDKARPTVPLLADDAANFVAKFYYTNLGRVDGMALLSPCKSDVETTA